MKRRLLLALALGIGLAILVSATMSDRPTRAQGTCDRYVLAFDGGDTTDCSDENLPCRTVQYAIDQASDGDVICVADYVDGIIPGPTTYAETIVVTKSITLDGAWEAGCVGIHPRLCSFTAVPCAPEKVILNAQECGRVISISGNITPTIDCFTITGGDASGLGGDPPANDAGGGIYSQDAAPIIVHNVITGNYGCVGLGCTNYGRGGGIYLLNAPATAVISDNLITNNQADKDSTWGQGGGIMLRDSDARVLSNTIEYNRAGHSAGYGGGITVKDGRPTIADNTILHNVAGQGVQGLGGGIFVWSTTPTTIERNLIAYNQAINGPGDPALTSRGGGICYLGDPTVSAVIRNNTIRYNLASPLAPQHGEGGGIYLSGLVSPSLVSGNTLEGNIAGHNDDGNGGGIYVDDSEATIADNHLFDNSATWSGDLGYGGGLYVNGGAVVVQSNVITSNFGAGFPSTADGHGGGVAISGSLSIVQDNWIVGNGGTNGTGGAGGAGGGVYGYLGILQITGNTIASNTTTQGNAGFGGGLYLEQVTFWLDSNTILDNEAIAGLYGRGGGVRINNCPAFTLTNNIVAHNEASERGSGIAIAYSDGQLAHNTIAENQAGDGLGVYVGTGSDAAMINNIIVNHWQGIANGDPGGSVVTATHTLFEGNGADYGPGVTSTHEISGPAMLLPNYHLGGGSGAINTATTLSWATNDIDGDSRPFGAAPDVGADEATCLARVGGVDYTIIQDAVNAAASGQTVMVVEGVCYENIAITKTVTLEGGWTPTFSGRHTDPASVSTIDGMGAGRVISITEVSGSIAPRIDGFTITGGDATGLEGSGDYHYDIGGGIYGWYADVTVANCVISDNVASTTGIGWGGGLGFYGGYVTLRDSVVAGNVASTASNGWGGGGCFRFGTATVSGNTVAGNVGSTAGSGFGGGLWLANGNATLQGNTVRENTASIAYIGYGGGVYIYGGTANLDGDVVEGNRAVVTGNSGYGGGISANINAGLTANNVEIYDNTATFGGGVHVKDSANAVLENNMVVENRITGNGDGAGICCEGATVRLLHTTLTRNSGGDGSGLHVAYTSTVALTNTILVSHTVGITVTAGNTATLEGTLWGDGAWVNTTDWGGGGAIFTGAVNVRGNPAFVDPDNGDYHIGPGSAAIDAGVDAGVLTDIDGDTRPIGLGFDIGADEAWRWVFLPLVLR